MSDYEDFMENFSEKPSELGVVYQAFNSGISSTKYIFNEDKFLEEIKQYIDSTYNQHYSHGKYQSTDFIVDSGLGLGFAIGNIIKYSQRYGKKDTPVEWRKDLFKIIHYAIIALYVHDKEGQV